MYAVLCSYLCHTSLNYLIHYVSQAIKQAYVLLLGLDVLGNPFGLIRGVAEGFEDLFYEPYQVRCQYKLRNIIIQCQTDF